MFRALMKYFFEIIAAIPVEKKEKKRNDLERFHCE